MQFIIIKIAKIVQDVCDIKERKATTHHKNTLNKEDIHGKGKEKWKPPRKPPLETTPLSNLTRRISSPSRSHKAMSDWLIYVKDK